MPSATWRTRGVRQFIDVGAGLPTALNTHDIARRVDPHARVAYVDNDPIVISHARSLLAKSPGVIAVPGDMRDPGRILADAGLAELIDMAESACVILSGVLHFTDAGTARDVAAAFAQAIAPGSYLIISVGSGNRSEGDNFTSAYTAARIYIHSPEEIAEFLRRPRTRASRRDLGAVLVRRRPDTEPEAAHGDLPRRRSPEGMS